MPFLPLDGGGWDGVSTKWRGAGGEVGGGEIKAVA